MENRPLPKWFDDAKFGIFIHWGLFSIPAFAPRLGKISDVFKDHYDQAVALTPYTEWYANAIKISGSPSAEFHRDEYANQSYVEFRKDFERGLEQWDPMSWATLFKHAGAKYVVLVTKHHDGYCLWPSNVTNPHQDNWVCQRDLVAELAVAVRAVGLRFGLYYSGGIDWSFNTRPLQTLGDFVASTPGGDYPDYAYSQFVELIDRYQPSVLWNDISWPDNLSRKKQLLKYYYDTVPDGVVNDRWQTTSLIGKSLKLAPIRSAFDWLAKRHIRKKPDSVDGVIPKPIAYSDFRTPEYAAFAETQEKKWETTRGMSHSFGFNRNDTESDYESTEALLHGLLDAVSKNGNLLLNVGPRGVDGKIPLEQVQRLKEMGDWLRKNGAAVYDTRPWIVSSGTTDQGIDIRYTQNKGLVYLILLGVPTDRCLKVLAVPEGITGNVQVQRLDNGGWVNSIVESGNLALEFESLPKTTPAFVLKLTGIEASQSVSET